jgi:hypothetical protein
MSRKFLAIFLSLTLCWTTVACSSQTSTPIQSTSNNTTSSTANQISSGKYPVQQASYDDANGEYSLMLLNATPPVFRTTDLQMARLTEEEIANKEKTYVEINGDRSVMHLTEDFKIEYVHNVTETQTNPQTGQPETVVVRQQSSFWAPFAGALAGQALGSLLFTPQYYVPPLYQPGIMLTGYGGYGNTYNRAIDSYRTRHNEPPVVEKNRQTLRTTGNIRRPSSQTTTTSTKSPSTDKSSGSGYGSSKLRSSDRSTQTTKHNNSFGSTSRNRSRSGVSRRRR